MGQATSRCPTIAESRIRSQVIRCVIYGGHVSTGIGFSPSISVFPSIIIFHQSSIPIFHSAVTHIQTWPLSVYRGADKSLARPGRKQANVSVRMS